MTAYLYNAPAGIKGSITRIASSVVEPIQLGTPTATSFGVPMKISSGKAIPFAGGETVTDLYGFLVREVPSGAATNNSDAPSAGDVIGILKSGYMNVVCSDGTPTRGGIVYIRVVAAGPKLVGDLEAVADGVNSIVASGVEWASEGRDTANGNIAEIHKKY